MKTAILKTNLWDDDTFYELNIDTKLLYLLLSSSPERGVSDIYMVSDRILSARSGLSIDQLRICKKQLIEKGLAEFSGKYIHLKGCSYVLPKKGRFTEEALTREYEELPKEIVDIFNSSLIVEHYNSTLYKDNNNNIDNNKNNNNSGYSKFVKAKKELLGSK